MVISIEAKTKFDKIQHIFMIKKKALNRLRIFSIYSYEKPLSNILLNEESGCSP